MLAVQLNELSIQDHWIDGEPHKRLRAIFPLLGRGPENEESSVVYFELEPGNELEQHTDSAEEVLFVVQGRLEVHVGDETGIVEGPAFALVPTLVPHGMRNIGSETAKIAGFFTSRYTVSEFKNALQPMGVKRVDTAQVEQALLTQ